MTNQKSILSVVLIALVSLSSCNLPTEVDEADLTQLLFYEVQNNNLSQAKKLLDQGVDANAKNSSGLSLLHYAVCDGNLEMAQTLAQHGADVKESNRLGWTLLHDAA